MPRSKSKRRFRNFLRTLLKYSLCLLLFVLLLTVAQVAVLRFVNPPCTVIITWQWIQGEGSLRHYRWAHEHWRPLEEIASPMIKAVLAAEDQRFLTHHGFDFVEMRKALGDILSERRTRGASTISMQVARTVFLWPERSLTRKVAEAYYTVLIEMLWSKGRILEMYLNTVDWGTGIIGVEAAARRYFQTSAGRITPSQGALLAAILPGPHRWSPTKPSRYVRERKRRIMKDMEKISLP